MICSTSYSTCKMIRCKFNYMIVIINNKMRIFIFNGYFYIHQILRTMLVPLFVAFINFYCAVECLCVLYVDMIEHGAY
jgi:hypothetical protein